MYAMLYTETKGSVPQVGGLLPPHPIRLSLRNLYDSVIASTLVIIVLDDTALKSVSIILLRPAKRLALRLVLSLEERRHTETRRKI